MAGDQTKIKAVLPSDWPLPRPATCRGKVLLISKAGYLV